MINDHESESMILHVDGDSFFAACEVSRHPELWGKPVVVGEERGIATAMSYEAKKLGITRATPIFKIKKDPAWKHVTVLSGHYDLYEMYSDKLYNMLCDYCDEVEHYSIDECFAKVTPGNIRKLIADKDKNISESSNSSYISHQDYEFFLQKLKSIIQSKLGITFSFGIAVNKVLAKVASKFNKPNGATVIEKGSEDRFLQDLPIGSIWGIGYRTAEKLRNMGIQTALLFKNFSEKVIIDTFAEPITRIQSQLKGRAVSHIHTEHEDQKSLQSTRSFAPASNDVSFLYSELSRNVEEACERLRESEMYGKHISIFIKTKETEKNRLKKYFSLSKELPYYTNSPIDILKMLKIDFRGLVSPDYTYKSTGITIHGLRHKNDIPEDFLGEQNAVFDKNAFTDAIDALQKRFGNKTIQLGSSLISINKRRREAAVRNKKDHYIYNLPLPYLGRVS